MSSFEIKKKMRNDFTPRTDFSRLARAFYSTIRNSNMMVYDFECESAIDGGVCVRVPGVESVCVLCLME